jgi:hypothetical protein
MDTKKIRIPIYFGKLVIVRVKKISEVSEKYQLGNTDSYASITFEKKSKKHNPRYYIVLQKNTPTSVIVHEVIHLVNYIFKNNGIELDRYNDEPQAYLAGWLFSQIQKFK